MLQQMRKFAKSWVASIFLGVLALSFGVWGIADIFTGSSDTSVAQVGNVKISQDEFQSQYQTALRNQSARMGSQLSAEQAQALGLPEQTLSRIIDRTAIDLEVDDLGLTATDKAVAAQIRSIPAFAGPSGSFDHATFLRAVNRSGFTEQSFIAAVRGDTARSQLLDATKNGLQAPPGYVRALFDYLNEVRAVHYVVVPPTAAGTVAKPSDAELQAYVKAHADRFSTPEYRQLNYAAITPEDLASEVSVTDKQLRNEYELRKADYQIPEKRDVEQITFPDQKAAEAASAELQAGKSFEDIAKARGLKASDTNLGELQEADLGAERGKAAFAVAAGGVTKPVKSTFGWVILKVTKIVPGENKSFDEVKAKLKTEVLRKLAVDKISDIVNKFEDAMAGGANLMQAAAKSGMKAVHVAAVDKAGQTPQGAKADVPANPQFLSQVFQADVGVAGDPFQTQDGSAYAIKVDGVIPPKLKPLNEVRAQAEAEWMTQQRQKAILAKAKALTAQANKDNSLAAVAKSLGTRVQQSEGMQRGAAVGNFPADLVAAIFDAPPGTTVFGKAAKSDDFVIARVTGVSHPPALTSANPQYRQFADQIGSQIGEDIPSAFAMAARQRQGVEVHQKAVDRIVGTGS